MNPNSAPSGTYASKFLKLNNELNFNLSKAYVSKKNKSLSNLSAFSSLANSSAALSTGRKLKCLLVGDARVGKTALMFWFLKRVFQPEYQPTIVDDYEVKINHNGDSYTLSLFDTAGQVNQKKIICLLKLTEIENFILWKIKIEIDIIWLQFMKLFKSKIQWIMLKKI